VGVTLSPTTIESGKACVVSVNTTCLEDGTIVQNATVSISCSQGTFLVNNQAMPTADKETDAEGLATFVFVAPETTTTMEAVLTINVSRSGYASWQNETSLTVTPTVATTEGGWPILMILLILIPVIVLVIVAILIKTKVIVISSEQEE
jgi:hypothetical protein